MRKALLLMLAAALVLTAGAAWAAIDNTNHDMITFNSLPSAQSKKGICSFCHVPHKAAGDKLFPSGFDTTGLSGATTFWSADPTARVCWQCHGTVTGYGTAENINPYNDTAHKRSIANLNAGDGFVSAEIYGDDGTDISCSSCHNPHNNDTRPFLRDNGANDTMVEGVMYTFCDDCHDGRTDNANTGTRTQHPYNERMQSSSRASILASTGMGANFKNAWAPLGSTISTQSANKWNLGGKLIAYASTTDAFDCGTCHAVHNNETSNWAAADGATSAPDIDAQHSALTVYDAEPSTAGSIADMCTNCHNIELTYPGRGPGVSGESHPVEEFTPFGTSIDVTAMYKPNNDASLVCQSCHDIHYSAKPQVAAANSYALLHAECGDCHDSNSSRANHHPAGVTVNWNTTLNEGVERSTANSLLAATAIDWTSAAVNADTNKSAGNFGVTRTEGTVAYTFPSNVMTCGTCHGGGSSGAHNQTNGFPGLTGEVDESEMCVDCHGVNPSDQTASTYGGGSHYLGPITNATTTNYWQSTSGARTRDPEAGVAPKKSPDGTTGQGSLICESCHTLKISGVTFQQSINNDNESSTVDSVDLMLSSSGNSDEATTADGSGYLCTACHSAAPGGGSSHPVLPSYTTAATTGVGAPGNATTGAPAADNGVTLTASGYVNCESCHRAHDADSDSGTANTSTHQYILENAQITNGYMDQQVLCNACHGQGN